jgi:anti-sigma B factor antagonist
LGVKLEDPIGAAQGDPVSTLSRNGMSAWTVSRERFSRYDDLQYLNDFRNDSLRDALYDLVQSRREPRVALDLLKIDYLSSSGIAILIGLKRRVETRQGKIVLFHVHPMVCDLLKVMKLDRYLPCADDEHAAIASLRPVSML